MSRSVPRSIAIINPMADFGIDTYTHELALGLAANGVRVDVFASDSSRLRVPSAPNYRRFHVMGSRLPDELQDATVSGDPASVSALPRDGSMIPDSLPSEPPGWKRVLRNYYLPAQLALRLRKRKYDVVWTQWPDLGANSGFWRWSRILRIPVVHTVHNILPHERTAGDMRAAKRVYGTASTLFVHSAAVLDELGEIFPAYAAKAVTIPHGSYTIYPRMPEARARLRRELGIAQDHVVLLICGAIRPYKNVNACISALAALNRTDVVLIIAGSEQGTTAENPLPETTARVTAAGIGAQVRLLPGFRDEAGMAELFETADVLLLPYLKSYGSGLLMLGITFGKYILATRSGMEESASAYPRAILLDGSSPADVKAGIEKAATRIAADPSAFTSTPPELGWNVIAATCVEAIAKSRPAR